MQTTQQERQVWHQRQMSWYWDPHNLNSTVLTLKFAQFVQKKSTNVSFPKQISSIWVYLNVLHIGFCNVFFLTLTSLSNWWYLSAYRKWQHQSFRWLLTVPYMIARGPWSSWGLLHRPKASSSQEVAPSKIHTWKTVSSPYLVSLMQIYHQKSISCNSI